MPNASCRCSSGRSPIAACRRGRSRPMAAMPARIISRQPRRAASLMSPSTRSAAWRSKTWSRAAGFIASCATSAPGSRPGFPASSEPTVWHAAPGAGSIISRPTSGPRWWRTTWCCSPASNRHRPRLRPATSMTSAKSNQLVHPRSSNDSFGLRHYFKANTVSLPDNHRMPRPSKLPKNVRLWTGTSYTPVESYYRLVKTAEADPEFDTKRAKKKLRRYVESHDYAIRLKAEIMVDHFHEQVIGLGKIGGQARAMVVTSGIGRAIQYFHSIRDYLGERKSPYRAIVAFSGEHEYGGAKVTEATLNKFPSREIPDTFETDPYRFLICADKFQTGYDQPLLHTMYVDKPLSGIKAVQTLSRLNRAHPKKHDVFVLDFINDTETIRT